MSASARYLVSVHSFSVKRIYLITCICFVIGAANGQPDYVVDDDIREAYALIFELEFQQASALLDEVERNSPDNLLPVLLRDYITFFELFVTEDEDRYDALKGLRSERLDRMREGPTDSPWYLYSRAEIHLHWALLRMKFEDYLPAAVDVNRAFRLLKKNEEEFPEFAPTYKSIGILRMAVGTIPDKYMWAVKFFSSLEGSIESGLADLEYAVAHGQATNMLPLVEARYLYAQALLHFANDPKGSWNYLREIGVDPSENELACFMTANIAMRTGHNDEAIGAMQQRPVSSTSFRIEYIDMMLGRAKLFRGDEDADVPILRFLEQFGGVNYRKEAYQKLAWYNLINGDRDAYMRLMNQCKNTGNDLLDEDKNADKEAKSGEVPHPQLLIARLRFDGGYLEDALTELNAITPATLNREHSLEYVYRKARVFHEMGRLEDALMQYDETIQSGEELDFYYACNAALQSGLIYEQLDRPATAERYYEMCLDMSPSDYQVSLHQKAKAGLGRLRTKQ